MSALFIATVSGHHEESHLIYGPLESILFDQGFPLEYELDEFNLPLTGTPLSRLQLWLCRLRRKIRSDIQLLHPWATFSRDMLLSHNNQDHTFKGDHFISVLNQQTRLLLHIWRPYFTHRFNNALTLTMHISLRHLAAKMPSQLHHSFLPSFLPSYETCSINVNPLFHAAIKTIIKIHTASSSSLSFIF